MNYIWHVSLDTGNTRRFLRADVDDVIAEWCRRLLPTGGSLAPALPNYRIEGSPHGKCWLGAIFRAGIEPPIVTVGVAGNARGGARLWREILAGGTSPAMAGARAPSAPWCASRIDAGMTLLAQPIEAFWIADFKRCLAWAWLERIETSAEQPPETPTEPV